MAKVISQPKHVQDAEKIAGEDLRVAFFMLDMVIGRAATDLIVKELHRRGVMLYQDNKSYSINDIKFALRNAFNEDGVSALVDFLKRHLRSQ